VRPSQFRLLHLDIETAPAQVYTWALHKQDISVDQIIEPTSLLCFSAKWHGEDKMIFHKSEKRSGPEFNKMVRAMHTLLHEADAVCHYNGCAFDIPRVNQEFLRLGLPPPPTIPQVDLKKVVMSKFSFVSSKLAFIGPELKIGAKVANEGWRLWRGCLAGDAESWKRMETYNRQDVALLERLYTKLLPWIDGHPNMNLFVDEKEPVCPSCGSDKLRRRGEQVAATYIYARYNCKVCGRWSRARVREKTLAAAGVR
jgi:hypothetical protein